MHVPLNIQGIIFEDYQCHDNGQIYSLKNNIFLKQWLCGDHRQKSSVSHSKKHYFFVSNAMGWSWENHGIQQSPLVRHNDFKLGVGRHKLSIDHIDRDSLNNNLSNLRICTDIEQSMNSSSSKKSSSEFKGVSSHGSNRRKPYYARFEGLGVSWHGSYETEEEAAAAYNARAKRALLEKYGPKLGRQLIDEMFLFNTI
jgi:hypothetical protein|tara:strand:- start:10672 stop:11265 length:594 start_codon:yes stop_codon:yes gene_type:complete